MTVRRVAVPLRGPGQSPVLPSACWVGSLRSVGRCSGWCRFRVRGAGQGGKATEPHGAARQSHGAGAQPRCRARGNPRQPPACVSVCELLWENVCNVSYKWGGGGLRKIDLIVCRDTLSLKHPFPQTPFPSNTLSLKHPFPQTPFPSNTLSLKHPFPQTPFPSNEASLKHPFPQTPFPSNTASLKHPFPQTPFPSNTLSLKHPFPPNKRAHIDEPKRA